MGKWFDTVETITKDVILWRRQKKFLKRQRQKKKHPVRDWVEAFLWAALVVLLINQFLIQAYKIPSGSMKNTLLDKDRIFVNKFIYGPELVPGSLKLPSFHQPKQSNVIIFENPSYLSKGSLFDVVQRVIYMVTLSMVDIDKDQYGNTRAHFLIKRAIGVGGDRIRFLNGNVQFFLPDKDKWIYETDLQRYDEADYKIRRILRAEDYEFIKMSGIAEAYDSARLPMSTEMERTLLPASNESPDRIEWNRYRYKTLHSIYPHDPKYGGDYWKQEQGWFIPEGWIFPLGDNRDNSRDARFFGPVSLKKVLGKALFIYLPINRIGVIE